MNTPWKYRCTYCGHEKESDAIIYQCDCVDHGHNLYVEKLGGGVDIAAALQADRRRDLWRYEPLLPVGSQYGSKLNVGGTPLLEAGSERGVNLFIKDDTRNPSGSLKDRATELALAVARFKGHTEIITASTGNAAASLACIAAAQGMRARIVVPKSTPAAKLAQLHAYGASVQMVDGSYDDAVACARDISAQEGIYCRSTGYNPFVREGKKTCAFEIAEQLNWQVPDWVIVPCGDGSILSGLGKGFEQLLSAGCIQRLPRLVAAQAESSASIAATYAGWRMDGTMPSRAIQACPSTAADSIAVGQPADYVAAIRALNNCDGLAVPCSEEQIRDSWKAMGRRYGVWVEPSSAAAYAALLRLIEGGIIKAGESAVIVATGTGLKDPAAWSGE